MRLQRYGFILLSLYMIFFGGGTYFQVPIVRYFHHVLLSVLLIGWLGWRLYKGRGLPPTPLNSVLYVLVAVWGVSIIFSQDPRMSLEAAWGLFVNLGIFWFIANAFQRARDRLVIETVFLMAATAIFISLLQIADVWFGLGIERPSGLGWAMFFGEMPLPWMQDMRIWLPLGVSTWVAGFVAPLLIICVGWALSTYRRSHRVVLAFLVIALTGVLFLTFSRGGYIAAAAGIGLFVLLRILGDMRDTRIFNRRNLIIGAGSLVTLATAGFLVLTISGSRGSSDQLRTDLWRSATEMIQTHPLTGVGIGQFGRELRDIRSLNVADDRMSSAHNLYLNMAAEAGIVLTVIVGIWMGIVILRTWWMRRQDDETTIQQRLRLDTMLAALAGLAVHNLVDTLIFTASVALAAVIIVYLTVKPAKSRLDTPPQGNRIMAVFALLVFAAYGLWFALIVDPSHRAFNNSVRTLSLEEAQRAEARDPALNLYDLQVSYLIGMQAFNNPTPENIAAGIAAYEDALVLEPTWTIGWINLAGLHELTGDLDAASNALMVASRYSTREIPVATNRARIAEQIGTDDEAIITAYRNGILFENTLPLSPFWMETPLRREAVMRYAEMRPIDIQYRIAVAHDLIPLTDRVPATPQTTAEYWVVGEHKLAVEGDAEAAVEAFTAAIALEPMNSDLYVSRARALVTLDTEAARRDVDRASLYRPVYEYPNAIRAALASTTKEHERYLIAALPPKIVSQNFEGVLYGGRVAQFRVAPSMRAPGPGNDAMQPWYDLAALYIERGDLDTARDVYEAIRVYAPYDERAVNLLGTIPESGDE